MPHADATEWFGEPHTLTVLSVEPPSGPFDDGELEYEIEHPATCKVETRGAGEHAYDEHVCDIAHNIDAVGLACSLRYSGTPITEPGTYRIQGWGTKTYFPQAGWEYDTGIGVMDNAAVS